MNNKIWNTVINFTSSPDWIEAVIASTKADWNMGNSFKVEIFSNGNWRLLWSQQIGNLYDNPDSIIFPIPKLSEDSYDSLDIENTWDEIEMENLKEHFLQVVRGMLFHE